MEHSIAARFSTRPAARFPRPSAASQRRRLGLSGSGAFRPATTSVTVLRRDEPRSFVRLLHDARSIAATRPVRRSSGHVRPVVSPTWARSVFVRRASAPVAPWRG